MQSPVVVVHSGNFEAPPPPNVTAIEQLLAKEERENAKAAAKKAKKQKQKAKKQQQQQQLDEEAEDRKRLLEQEEEDRLQEQEQQSHIPSSQHTSEQEQPQMSRQHQSQQQQSPGQPDQQEGERRQHGGQQQLGSADQVTASVGDLSIGEMSGPADSPQDNFGKSRVSEHASGTAENQDPPQLQAESSNGEDFLQELFCCPLTKVRMLPSKRRVWYAAVAHAHTILSPCLRHTGKFLIQASLFKMPQRSSALFLSYGDQFELTACSVVT